MLVDEIVRPAVVGSLVIVNVSASVTRGEFPTKDPIARAHGPTPSDCAHLVALV